MKKRLMALFLVMTLTLSLFASFTVFAEEDKDEKDDIEISTVTSKNTKDEEKIEIKLKIGSSVITINGKDVTGEPPFVVNGVTMVPLRVISEAFGSEVAWDGATNTITLTYREVVMILQINNKNAKINKMNMEMLEAPVIYNDTTMVPLRFISENFGADVSYEEATQKVSVVKVLTKSTSIKDYAMILKNTSKEMVGDSYYGWMIKMPKNMKLTYRSFNGNSNIFTSDNGEYDIHIDLYNLPGDVNMDTIWAKIKQLPSDHTLLSQKREDKSSYGYAEMSYKNSDYVVDRRVFFKNGTLTIVDGARDVATEKANKQNVSDIITTFSYGYTTPNDKVEDLSDVDKDGFRIFKENKYKWSAKIPAAWRYIDNVSSENYFLFQAPLNDKKKIYETFILQIYSKEDGLELSQWAERDRQSYLYDYNPKAVDVTTLMDKTIGNYKGIGFNIEIKDGSYSSNAQVAYLYGKDYRYQINTAYATNSSDKALIDGILRSFSYEELKYNDIGEIAESEPPSADDNATQKVKNSNINIEFKIPASWEYEETSKAVYCYTSYYAKDSYRSFVVGCESTNTSLNELTRSFIQYFQKEEGYVLLSEASITISGKQGYYTKFEKKNSEGKTIIKPVYFVIHKGKLYIMELFVEQINDGERTKYIFDSIIKSIVLT